MANIIIVDDDNQEIGVRERSELRPGDILRVCVLWITNSNGDILLAKRAHTKESDPGKWGTAVAGAVEEGERFEDAMIRESKEELGLHIERENLIEGNIIRIKGMLNDTFCQEYKYITDQETFTLQEEEVAETRWFKEEELKELFQSSPEIFIASMPQWRASYGL